MRGRGISTIGRSGVAALVALTFALLALPGAASAASGSIKGTVTLAAGGANAPGVEACAEQWSGGFDYECASAGADGSYVIAGLTPGQYAVSFYAADSGLNLAPSTSTGPRPGQTPPRSPSSPAASPKASTRR